jgi:hypothetical protein
MKREIIYIYTDEEMIAKFKADLEKKQKYTREYYAKNREKIIKNVRSNFIKKYKTIVPDSKEVQPIKDLNILNCSLESSSS